ncbi:MAG: MFS transporter, partial [Bdellovibrionia bacterium]
MLSSHRVRFYFIWICASIFYVYQFILRVSPSLIVDDLMGFFHLDASGVAQLSSLAMYAYALMQIPAGLSVDAFGVRRILMASVVLCLLGVSLFASTHDLHWAQLGRILLGTGSASAFLCVGKVSALWFPPERRAVLLGMTMAMGKVGGYLGNVGLSLMIAQWRWHTSLLLTHSLGLLTILGAYLMITSRQEE